MDAIALLKADHKAVEGKCVMFSALGNRPFKAKAKIVKEVIAALTKHAAIEEALFYPAARERLQDSGYLVLDCQAFGAHPHPRSPDEPPLNAMASAIARPLDAMRDAREAIVKQVRHKRKS